MKHLAWIATTLFCIPLMASAANRETPNLGLRFLQDGGPATVTAGQEGTAIVQLKPSPFEINFPSEMLNGCADTSPAIFEHTGVGTDTMQDFKSCLLIFKSAAMPDDATYLPLSDEYGFSLNPTHGAQTLSDKRSQFRVTHLERSGEGQAPVALDSLTSPVYVTFFVDTNKNQKIDDGELEHLELRFK